MAEREGNMLTEDENTSRNGEENFKEEIKDYAKTTMNELLGMFGYDEEITSESVDSLDIKVPSGADELKGTTSTAATHRLVMTTAGKSSAPVAMTSVSMSTTPPIVLPVSEDSPSDTPIIVKVEGNTSVSDIIRQQNDVAAANVSPDPPATEPNKVIQSSTPSTATSVSQSTVVQPALKKQPITTQRSRTSSSDSKSVQSSTTTATSSMSTAPVVKKLSSYLQYSYQLNQNNRPCTWCKKSTQLKNFTFREDTRVLECRGICSEECFEKAALSIDVRNANIKAMQERIRQLRDTKRKKFASFSWPLFDWEQYLRETGSKGAPWSFFKQSATPPHNGFKPGMKLEVSDPRIIKCTCLATVVATFGPRIRCRFDGTDKSNDVWHIVDSTEIHPVGWCEANEVILQPPIGFRKDVGRYQTFLAKTLSSHSPESIIAPARIFKKEPDGPEKNKFYPGLKLEAMDPKNPALICVATVGKVEGEKIRVDFDGYLGSDFWCRFDSRNIFPVGWCALSGHPLQPPGNSKKWSKMQSATRTKTSKEPEEATGNRSARTHTTSSASSSPHLTSPAQDSNTTSTSSSYLEVRQSHLNRLSFPTVCVYVNHGCKIGQFLDPEKVSRLLPPYWRGRISDVLKPCLQGIVDCSYNQPTVFGFLRPGTGKTCIVARGNGQKLSCMLQTIDRVRIFWKVLDRFIEDLRCCENFMSSSQINGGCNKCQRTSVSKGRAKRPSTEASEALPSKTLKLCVQEIDESPPQVCSTSPAKTWTVDEVIKYMENTELADYTSLFKIHEIDGRALLLLNRDMIMSYMGLKLGPAIKLLSIVQELKPKQTCEG
ncbi:polycomb protein SCMH1-like [Actinia tenebrosa]|uniref:Polycomb protein SCMH1-like n=1 Tax=Actinia tenebrosa TaxID=6105 RepID=A0A6P8HR74_ACTTE|nr:polycomb protein SCMH1-like [Actinia tenebrosa]